MGSLVGSTLVLILPAILALKYECGEGDGSNAFHYYAASGMLVLGVLIAIFGFFLNAMAVSNS